MRIKLLGFGCAILSGFVMAACGSPDAPVISNLEFLGQAEENPTVLLFSVDFEDRDGDLGDGATTFLLNGETTSIEPLANQPLFIANNLPFEASTGTLNFVVELTLGEGENASKDEEFEFSVKMKDAAGYESNALELRLSLTWHAQ